MKRAAPVLVAMLLAASAAAAPARTEIRRDRLRDTRLYTEFASGCVDVDLARWTHPTRAIFDRQQIPLRRVQLCNGNRYAIFFAKFIYDPNGDTAHYYNQLYARLLKANGNWAYSIVDLNDDFIISVEPGAKGVVVIKQYEFFRPD